MVSTNRPGGMRNLVNRSDGLISREIFVSEEIHAQELERIFARTWLFVGHESQVPNPNDFFVSRMGAESVILTRDKQGELHVLLNTCMHRGMKVCRYDEGNTPVFSCPYHGWSYSTDGNLVSVPGELIGVPQFATAYHGELKKEEWGLISVPKIHNYKGSIWACWDPEAPGFIDYLGAVEPYLAAQFDSSDGTEGGRVAFAGVQKWLMPCNWKFAAENFIGDQYHGISHRSQQLSTVVPFIHRARNGSTGRSESVRQMSFLGGHGLIAGRLPETWNETTPYVQRGSSEILDSYFEPAHKAREERLNGKGPLSSWATPSTIFPNMSIGGGITTVAVWHPVGARMTEAWRFYFVDKDAPPEVKNIWRHDQIRYSGPAGTQESDDMENWNYASEASNGVIAQRQRYNYTMGIAHETLIDSMPGVRHSNEISEQNARGLYWRWAQLMDAENWDQIREWDEADLRNGTKE